MVQRAALYSETKGAIRAKIVVSSECVQAHGGQIMRINPNFVLRQLADTWVVLPLAAETVDFNGMITLNESGVLLWKTLEQGADVLSLVAALRGEYVVSQQQAMEHVEAFLAKLRNVGCLESE